MTAPDPDPNAEYWRTSEVAAYLGVTVGTVSSYRIRGQMPEPDRTIGDRTHLWTPRRIIEWHEQRPGHGGRPPNRPANGNGSNGSTGRRD